MGIIFDIQRCCVHDGPGIRTSVFLKGCNMRCVWCHNPESLTSNIQLAYHSPKCIQCGACVKVCEYEVHKIDEQGNHHVDFKNCRACGKCIDVCSMRALTLYGKEYDVEEVMQELRKDKAYYEQSAGGITFSGGEATLQYDFLLSLLKACKQEHYHVVLETNGMLSEKQLYGLLPNVDLYLFDYKAMNQEVHDQWTKGNYNHINQSLKILQEEQRPVILRCPIIPGINDTAMHFDSIKKLAKNYDTIQKVELMSYHDMGKHKWGELGLTYALANLKSVSAQQKEIWEKEVGVKE